MRILEHPT